MDHNSMIEVIAAHRDGKKIQCQYKNDGPWHDVVAEQPTWDFNSKDWRVKPKPLEMWANVYPGNEWAFAYKTKAEADSRDAGRRVRCVHMREVVE